MGDDDVRSAPSGIDGSVGDGSASDSAAGDAASDATLLIDASLTDAHADTSMGDDASDAFVRPETSLADAFETDASIEAASDAGCDAIDLATNALNCGACGHSCLGGGCSAGACQPVVLASAQNLPEQIAVGGGFVYWSTNAPNAAILRTPTSAAATGTPTTLASIDGTTAIAIDSTNVYWGDTFAKEIFALPLAGSDGGTPTTVAHACVDAMTLDANKLYWVDDCAGVGTVQSAPTTGVSDGGAPTVLGSSVGSSANIVASANQLYVSGTSLSGPTFTSSLITFSETGGAARTLYSDHTASSVLIAVDSTNIYYTADSNLLQIPLAGLGDAGTPLVLASVAQAGGLVSDLKYVYFTDIAAKTISAVPIGGGQRRSLASGMEFLALAQDATALYATVDDSAGTIIKLAK